MQITSLIGKQILTPAGENIGYVLAAYPSRDLKKVSCFLCADEDEEEFFLPAKCVLSYSDVLIATRTRMSVPTGVPCPVSYAAYTHTGSRMGTVEELILGEDADPLFIVYTDGAKVTVPAARAILGDALIVYPAGFKKPAPARKPPRKEEKKAPVQAVQPAVIQAEPEPASEAPIAQPTAETVQAHSPEDALNRVNLLGRRLKKSVYDENGYPVALAGDIITKNTVSLARRSNRLLQLTVNTLTNVF